MCAGRTPFAQARSKVSGLEKNLANQLLGPIPCGPQLMERRNPTGRTEKGGFSGSPTIVAQRLLFLWFTLGFLKAGNGCTSSQVEGSGPPSVAACVPNGQETSQSRSVSHKESEEANKC